MHLFKKVLIVPLWNWNCYCNGNRLLQENVLIVPLRNWNADTKERDTSLPCINCTVVELKRFPWCYLVCLGIVLIVPLWNWNFPCLLFSTLKACINCTVVELKQIGLYAGKSMGYRINCTVVELKHALCFIILIINKY